MTSDLCTAADARGRFSDQRPPLWISLLPPHTQNSGHSPSFVAEVKTPDGKISYPFGEKPKGILVFTPDGHFTQIHVAGDVPKIASNNRLTGTPEEYGAIMRRSLSVFGTYTGR